MITIKYNPKDLRYIFMVSDKPHEMIMLTKYLNKIPSYMFMPSFKGVPTPEVFLNKFNGKSGVIYYCHSGLWRTVYNFCIEHQIEIEGIDNFFKYTPMGLTKEQFKDYVMSWKLNIEPRSYQLEAAWLILKYKQSLSELATRAGKTLIAYIVFRYMLEHGAKNILMIVPSIQLVKQGVEDLKEYKEFFRSETVWAKGEFCESSNLTIGTYQSLVKKADKRDKKYDPHWFDKFDVVCVDEAHHLVCDSINKILGLDFMKNIKLKFGFTGTLPDENTIDSFCCHALMGPKIQEIRAIELMEEGYLAEPVITQIRIQYPEDEELTKQYIHCGEYLNSIYKLNDKKTKILLPKEKREFTMVHEKELPLVLRKVKEQYSPEEYKDYLCELCKANGANLLMLEQMLVHRSEKRVNIILNLLKGMNKNCIVFAQHVEYLKYLKTIFEKTFPNRPIYIIHGATALKKRLKIINQMLTDQNAILCASYDCVGTGLTFKNIDYGIFAQSFKSKIINKQSLGRLMLKTEEKSKFYLYDLVDCFPTKRLYLQGLAKVKIYKDEGYECNVKKL